jgi:FMN phosphatase YigB (HAD superfamily)
MSIVIFDFDDTIFDTKKLKNDLFLKIADFGFHIDDVAVVYEESKDKNKNYMPNTHLDFLLKKYKNDLVPEEDWFLNFDYTSYVFPEIFPILNSLKSQNHKIILLSKGEGLFQEIKIKNSKITDWVDEVFIVANNKEDFLKEKNFETDVYFINDKNNENEVIRKNFPDFIVFENINDFYLK